MNKDYILYNLHEARRQLSETIKELESDEEYDNGSLIVDMQHLYHHINTAWNARNSSGAESQECREEDFYKWRKFPEDIIMEK
jgi:predicted transposase YbfD/YdcC